MSATQYFVDPGIGSGSRSPFTLLVYCSRAFHKIEIAFQRCPGALPALEILLTGPIQRQLPCYSLLES